MKKIISALLLLTSCTQGIDQLPVQEIDFTPEFTAQVKGTATTDEILMNKGFGVFAATGKIGTDGNNAFAADGELKSFMNNVPVRNKNGSWIADPVHYWPDGYDVSFFAYAPYIGQLTSEADWTEKQVSLTYTPDKEHKGKRLFGREGSINKDGTIGAGNMNTTVSALKARAHPVRCITDN